MSRARTVALLRAAQLMLRVWRLSRRTGVPFDTLLQLRLQMLDEELEMLRTLLYQQLAAEQARRN